MKGLQVPQAHRDCTSADCSSNPGRKGKNYPLEQQDTGLEGGGVRILLADGSSRATWAIVRRDLSEFMCGGDRDRCRYNLRSYAGMGDVWQKKRRVYRHSQKPAKRVFVEAAVLSGCSGRGVPVLSPGILVLEAQLSPGVRWECRGETWGISGETGQVGLCGEGRLLPS